MRALLVVDIQNDFMPGGALGIPNADEIVPVINRLMRKFAIVVTCQDWHPKDHVSFSLWPVHCVHGTSGADLYPTLETAPIVSRFYKGTDQAVDSYSAFFDNARRKSTGLATFLKANQIDEVYLAGLATDYCVLYSALDALDEGFTVYVIIDACRAINLNLKDEDHALAMMAARGVKIVNAQDV